MGKRVILSSAYRKMLEVDDKRRFAESHSAFWNYQTEFLDDRKKYLDEMSLSSDPAGV